MNKVNVVGAGLAGSIITRFLRSKGMEVRTFDPGSEVSASEASSNLFIESWLNSLTNKNDARLGIGTLKALYHPNIEYPFSTGLGYAMKVAHIPQRHILENPDVVDRVSHVRDHGVTAQHFGYLGADFQVVCAGHRTVDFDPSIEMSVKVGHCLFFRGRVPKEKTAIRIVSPYRHEKLYQFDEDTVYYADSVALKLSSYEKRKDEVLAKTRERARGLLGPGFEEIGMKVGYRPITKGHNFGICKRYSPRVWIVTGGGKSGMVAYAVAAHKLWEEMQCA